MYTERYFAFSIKADTRQILSTYQQNVFALLVFSEKSGTSCYNLVTRLTRPTDSQQVVATSVIPTEVVNKLLTTNFVRRANISLAGATCSNL